MATITAAGTWTALNVDFTKMAKVNAAGLSMPNVPIATGMQLEQLKNADLPELTQFIQAMADGYAIHYNAAKQLFYHIVTAHMNRETPTVSRVGVGG